MEEASITLSSKPGASLRISFYTPPSPSQPNPSSISPTTTPPLLLVFLNGLILPRSSWTGTINSLLNQHSRHFNHPKSQNNIHILTYDRYGQGDSDPDPTDPPAAQTPHGHDARAIVSDLHELLTHVCQSKLNTSGTEKEKVRLIFIANSIGCPLARLYSQTYPTTSSSQIVGYIFLDSMMANSDFVSPPLFPDPDSRDFDESKLPDGVSVEDIRHARDMFSRYFHPSVPNPERFDRRNLKELLPYADRPVLPRVKTASGVEVGPKLLVVGHDWDVFAENCESGALAVPKRVINAYVNPTWARYNEGLTRLVCQNQGDGKGKVRIAKGCGHFIQKDDPEFVANEISAMLDELLG